MKNILLSICISSYNRGDKCAQLVEQILTVNDDRYNLFICDDHSDEKTIVKLKSLVSERVTLIQNEENVGACKNWFKTIECGNGKYILHILDRDDIDINKLELIVGILDGVSVGAGYFGKSAIYPVDGLDKRTGFSVCKKGKEAFLTMAGVPVHPTGFFVEKETWRRGNYRKFFYQSQKYGIYPHSYVLSDIAVKKDMLYSPIAFYSTAYRTCNRESRFYNKSIIKNYWWLPDNVMETANRLILFCTGLGMDSCQEEFVLRRFNDGLNRATISYKKESENQAEMEHYGFHVRILPVWELMLASAKYWIVFLHIIPKLGLMQKNIRKKLRNIWFSNIKSIVRMMMPEKRLKTMLLMSNHNLASFRMMNQWVRIKQQGRNLSEFFEKKGYKKIAVYGMGYTGEALLAELKNTNTEVLYGIDRNAASVYAEIDVFSIEEVSVRVDAVVITLVDSFDEIVTILKRKIHCPIISLQDVIYALPIETD